MGIKKLLTVATMLVAGALGINAQNIIANWDGGSNTGKPTEFGWASSNTGRTWNGLDVNSGARVMTTYSGYKLEDGTAYSYDANSELSSKILWIRYNDTNETYTYTFNGLEAGKCYEFSGLVGWHNNSSAPTFTITVNGTEELAKVETYVAAKQTLYQFTTKFAVPENEGATSFTLKFKSNQGGDCMEALSALSITEMNGSEFENATEDAPYEMTSWLKDPSLEKATGGGGTVNAIPGWKMTYVLSGWLDGSPNTTAPSDGSKCYNLWAGNVTSIDMSQDIVLPVGKYKLSADLRIDNIDLVTDQGVYATVNGNTFKSGTITKVATKWNTIDGWNTLDTEFTVTNTSKVTIGISSNGTGTGSAGWFQADNVRLYYIGTVSNEEVLEIYKADWTTALNTAQATIADGTYTNVIGAEKTALQAEIDKVEPTTVAGYTEATTALTTATSAFTAAVTNYDNLVAEIAKAKALGIEEATANSYAATVTSTSATVLASTQDLKVDEYEYVTENYAYGVALGEWVSEATGTKAADFSNEHWSGTTHSYKNQDDSNNQGWHANSWSINFNQDVELPAGDYVFKVAARQASGDQVNTTIIVKNGETTLGSASDFPRSNNSRGINKEGATSFDPEDPVGFANNGNGFGWEWRFVKFTLAEEATVNIAINSVATASHQWVSFGDYTLQTNNEANIATIAYNIVLRDAEAAFNNDTYSAIQGTTRAELETAINAEPGATVDEIEASTETLKEKTQALIDTYNAKVAMDNALTAVKALNITTNVGTGAFQIPASAATAVTAAITSAEELTDEAVKADYEAATTALNNAKDTFNNAELNAPEAGKLYSIINNSDGYEFKGKAVTFKSASNADLAGNTTSMGYTELPGSAYPQGITFTAVPETLNGYILSYTREDGNTVYVGTGTSTGLGSNNDQIRPTTDPAKAVTIQIVPTATEGIWNLKNILANKNIGANNDSGFYTKDTYTSMTLAEVTPLTVTVSNDAAESKFKTLILPFDAELPEGVTAYSCEEVVNSVLNTVAVPSIEANTPYILSVEAGKSVEFTGVGGAYTDASYTAGYLTGGYTTGTVPTGSYVLQTQEGVQGFYKVAETEVNYVPYRAYLTVPSANAKAFFFGGDATAINGVEGAEGATEVVRFNAAGVQVAAPVKGLNIVKMSDGTVKKVMVK